VALSSGWRGLTRLPQWLRRGLGWRTESAPRLPCFDLARPRGEGLPPEPLGPRRSNPDPAAAEILTWQSGLSGTIRSFEFAGSDQPPATAAAAIRDILRKPFSNLFKKIYGRMCW
jgi:hypothetical protein